MPATKQATSVPVRVVTMRNEYASKAISTRYLGPTDTRPSRIVCTAEGGNRKVYSWNYELGVYENHAAAAKQFAEALDWGGEWVGGGTGNGFVFCSLNK